MTLSHNGKTNQPPVQVTGGCVFCLGGQNGLFLFRKLPLALGDDFLLQVRGHLFVV